jgi:acetolactate decarboxylase
MERDSHSPSCAMAQLSCSIPSSLLAVLEARAEGRGEGISHVVTSALSQYLEKPIHTLFQVSTSRALVAGEYSGAVSSRVLLRHGDFGLGTFEHLDGELVVLDGHVYRAESNGRVSEAPADAAAPFAVVTTFAPTVDVPLAPVDSLDALARSCDSYRHSDNLFYAFRLDGHFHHVRTRVVSPPANHGRLVDAARAQAEFEFREMDGTLVGVWSPSFTSALSIPGYHFHFLSDDRHHGGHLLVVCSTGPVRMRMEPLADFHLALPENESFLNADLNESTAAELAAAEHAH